MAQFLHGAETIELDDGRRPITTVKTAVIGVVGEALDASPAVAASLQTGSVPLDDALIWTAVEAGRDGNAISVEISLHDDHLKAASVSVTGNHIHAKLAVDAEGVAVTTAAELASLVNLAPTASALVAVANLGDGAGIPAPKGKAFLAGGADEPFPLLKPVAIPGSRKVAEQLGLSGELVKAVDGMLDQAGALIIAVRAPALVPPEVEGSNVIAAIQALADAQTETGYKPRILVAPGYSHHDIVAAELEAMAHRLRGIAYVDCAQTASYTDAMKRARQYGERVEVMWPWVTVFDAELNQEVPRPLSERAAGLRVRIDHEKGVHWSKSNQQIFGVTGTVEPVQWALNDPNTVANMLNENKVSTVIREGGFRFWGNRTCSIDPKWAFECVRRTADMVNDSIERAHMWAVDRPGTTQYFQDVVGGVQAYFRQLKAESIIPGGDCWLDKELNTPETQAQGLVFFDFDFGTYFPMEQVKFRSRLNNGYLEEVLANV